MRFAVWVRRVKRLRPEPLTLTIQYLRTTVSVKNKGELPRIGPDWCDRERQPNPYKVMLSAFTALTVSPACEAERARATVWLTSSIEKVPAEKEARKSRNNF